MADQHEINVDHDIEAYLFVLHDEFSVNLIASVETHG
jgi:hypothetical protein